MLFSSVNGEWDRLLDIELFFIHLHAIQTKHKSYCTLRAHYNKFHAATVSNKSDSEKIFVWKLPLLGNTLAIFSGVTPNHSLKPFHKPSQGVEGIILPLPMFNSPLSVKSLGY